MIKSQEHPNFYPYSISDGLTEQGQVKTNPYRAKTRREIQIDHYFSDEVRAIVTEREIMILHTFFKTLQALKQNQKLKFCHKRSLE